MIKIKNKIKASMIIIMACIMCVGMLFSIKTDAYADSSKEYVYDNAGILTSDEISKLKSQCKKAFGFGVGIFFVTLIITMFGGLLFI